MKITPEDVLVRTGFFYVFAGFISFACFVSGEPIGVIVGAILLLLPISIFLILVPYWIWSELYEIRCHLESRAGVQHEATARNAPESCGSSGKQVYEITGP